MDYIKFIGQYKTAKDKDAFIKRHITTTYLPYPTKMSEAKQIAMISSHVNEKEGKLGEYKRDTMAQYFWTQIRLITNYTDIKAAEGESTVGMYDELSESGALEDIIKAIPSSEVTMFTSMVQMAMDDVYLYERDLPSYLETKMQAITMALGALSEGLTEITEGRPVENSR